MYLLLDASTKSIGISVVKNERVMCSLSLESGRTHSVDLMPAIDFALKSVGLTITDIDAIIVSNGPGSFTGIRIVMSVVKSICHAMKIPVYTASTLRTLSFHGRYFEGLVCPIMDARRNRVYTAIYDGFLGKELLGEDTFEIDELISKLKRINKKVLFVGDGVSVYADDIVEKLSELAVIGGSDTSLSSATGLIYLHRAGLTEKRRYDDVMVNYVRKPQAEREREKYANTANELG